MTMQKHGTYNSGKKWKPLLTFTEANYKKKTSTKLTNNIRIFIYGFDT